MTYTSSMTSEYVLIGTIKNKTLLKSARGQYYWTITTTSSQFRFAYTTTVK